MKAKFLIGFLIILFAHTAMSQVAIEGRVFDTMDSLGIPSSIINLNTLDTVRAKMDGTFSINAEIGHQLSLLFLGYVPRVITIQDYYYLEIGLIPAFIDHDFGWNRIYLGPSYDFNNTLFGASLEYLSNPLDGYSFLINPKIKGYWDNQSILIDSKLNLLSVIKNYKTDISFALRLQHAKFSSFAFDNFTFSVQPRIRGLVFNLGLSSSRYNIENQDSKYLGLLMGFNKELRISRHYFPMELNAIIWEGDIEWNLEVNHRIKRWLSSALSYQHYRDFNQLAISLSYSLRLDKPISQEY